MALAVLDGNQSATTLSSVVTGGEHIVAHSVVSLGTTAIANITSAVSGVNIGGTVTANINGTPSVTFGDITGSASIIGTPTVTIPQLNKVIASVATDGVADDTTNFVKIGGHQDGQNQVAHIVHVSAGGAMKVDASGSSVTFSQASVTFGAITGSASILNFPSTQTIAGTVTANVGGIASGVTIPVRLFAEAEGGPSSGQDTLVVCDSGGQLLINAKAGGASVLGYDGNAFVQVKQVSGSSVTIGSLPAISGTVTVGALPSGVDFGQQLAEGYDNYGGAPVQIIASSVTLPISGTVTANNPSGALTTRFGSVTTASVAQLTSCVTNTSRKYLLAQNISAGTVTIGIGFSPTTTQGIQLPAGGGLTFDAFCPTGAVYWLGAVTGAAFTILEG